MMSEKEYEEFKSKIKEKTKNRIYCSWKNNKGLDCKMYTNKLNR